MARSDSVLLGRGTWETALNLPWFPIFHKVYINVINLKNRMEAAMETPRTSIADAVGALRKDLAEAVARGNGQDLRFKVEGVDVELAVACEVSGNNKASFHVFGIGAELGGKLGTTLTHKVRRPLKPAGPDGTEQGTLSRDTVSLQPEHS